MSNTEIPNTIRQQIGVGVLMSLGASDLMADRVHVKAPLYDTLTFRARILTRDTHQKRIMRVRVVLDPSDTYSITVTYPKRGSTEEVVHYEAEMVYFDQLPRLLLALDQVI